MSEVYVKEPATNGKAILRTTHGDLEIELWATEAPKACRNFCQLILEGYYNGTTFHRVIRDFIIQGGDGTNTGDGCESIYGQPFPDEIHPRLKFRYRGMMGVASAGKGTTTNGSQFFIVLNRTPSLDGKHTLFAKVVGQTVYNLVRMAEVEVDKRDRPLEPPRILRAELVWDPFGDLEPRRIPEPPKASEPKSTEVQRRAPIQNKRVLSFAADEDEDEEAEDDMSRFPSSRGKSAHDLLADPRLLKDSAYPEQQHQKRPRADARDPASKPTKRASSTASAVQPSFNNGTADTGSGSDNHGIDKADDNSDGHNDDDDDDESVSGDDESDNDVAQQRSNERQEAILKLKRDIAKVGSSGSQLEAKGKRPSVLEELRAGYVLRAPRMQAKGKEGKRRQAEDMMSTLRSFRTRLNGIVGSSLGTAQHEETKRLESKNGKKSEPQPEDGTFAAIWKEGDEEADEDWLSTSGLKFHVSADKAFKLDRDRARETLEIFDPLAAKGNSEVLAEARKKASEKLVPQRRRRPEKRGGLREDEVDRDRRRS